MQTKNCPFMTGNQDFSPGDIQFQLVYDRGQCAESSYLKVIGIRPMAPVLNTGPLEGI